MNIRIMNTISNHKTFNILPVLGVRKHVLSGPENVTGSYKNYKFNSYWEIYFCWFIFCLTIDTAILNKNSQ